MGANVPKRGPVEILSASDIDHVSLGLGHSFGATSGRYYPYGIWPETVGTGALNSDIVYFRPFVAHANMEVSDIGIFVSTAQASGLLRLGFYAPDPTNHMLPGVLLEDLGTVDASATGLKDASFSANRTLRRGEIVWLALQTNDTTIETQRVAENWVGTPIASESVAYLVNDADTYASGLPDPATPGIGNKQTPRMTLKVA